MPALRGPDGKIVYAPDDEVSRYLAGGYVPVGEAAAGAEQSRVERPDSGILGSVGALASSALSGATLGASDWLLKAGLTQGQFEQLADDRRQNPTLSGLGMAAGAIAPMVLSGGAATPAGALGKLSAGALDVAAETGGAAGAAHALGIAGTEGAIQNAGVYLSDVALGDRDLTAEGMVGALGAGFAFGSGGMVAAHGVVGGAIAARRMFARYAEGGEEAARAAEATWRDQGGAQLESFEQAAKIARGKLDEAQLARQRADVARKQAAADLAEARVAPIDQPPEPGMPAAPPAPAGAAGVTQADREIATMLGKQPEEITAARLNRERARLTGVTPEASELLDQRIADVTGVPSGQAPEPAPGDAGFRRVYSSGTGSVEQATQAAQASAPGPGFATMIRDLEAIPGVRRVEAPLSERVPGSMTEAEADLSSKLDEYAAARKEFDDLHARIDPDLDAAMRGLEPGDLQRRAVPVGEFGAPGQRGIKSPAEIEQAARDAAVPEPELASGTPSAMEATRAGKVSTGAGSKPSESPLKQGLPERARVGGKYHAEATPVEAARPPEPEPIAAGKTINELKRPDETADQFVLRRVREQGQYAFSDDPEGKVWLGSLGIDWTVPSNRRVALEMLRDDKAILTRADLVDMFDPEMVEASHVGDQFGDFHFIHDPGPRRVARAAAAEPAAPAAESDLESLLRGTRSRLDQGDGFVEMGAPARAEYRAAKEARTAEAAEHFRGKAIEAHVVPEYDALKARLDRSGSDYFEQTLPARKIADRGYFEPAGAGVDAVRMDKARQAIREGQREPVALGVSKRGEIIVENGRHRLAAAIEQDAPIRVKWTTAVEPPADMIRRGAARAAEGGETELEAMLRGTKARLDRGESMADVAGAKAAARREVAAEPVVRPREPSSANADTSLEALLQGTKERLDAGQAMRDIAEHPMSIKGLEMAHDAALERVAAATEPEIKQAAEREVRKIEEQMTRVGSRPGAVEDVAALAPAVHRLEKAAADLTEALGSEAPAAAQEHAKAFRAAEDKASESTVARMARAADDHAAAVEATQAEDFLGPGIRDRRVEAAKVRRAEAEAAHARARANEAQAKLTSGQAERDLSRAREAAPPAPPQDLARPGGTHGNRVIAAAHTLGYAAELGSDLGIPGIPRPHDIPVIGPILSAYLKYRALRAAAGRFVGRVPATANARAAELAARTRDGIARAVDRSLGLIEASGPQMRRGIVAGATVASSALSKRLVDDGGPDAPDGASVQRMAAARIREVAAVATNPRFLLDRISFETRGITDPQLITAVENHLTAMFAHLNEIAPHGPPPNPFTKQEWLPSVADAVEFGKRVAVANDPRVAFDMLEAGKLTPGPAETMRAVYPLLFAEAQRRAIARANDLRNPVPYRQLMQTALLFGVPLHQSLDPGNASVIRSAYATATGQAPQPQGAPPTPGIASPTNISEAYKTSFERSMGAR